MIPFNFIILIKEPVLNHMNKLGSVGQMGTSSVPLIPACPGRSKRIL